MGLKFAINGFGRIGRAVLRSTFEQHSPHQCVHINTLYDTPESLAYLLKHDSIHGRFPYEVSTKGDQLIIGEHTITLSQHRDPADCPWQDVDVVMECTGLFTHAKDAARHLEAGAQKVLISAPPLISGEK